MDRPGPVGLVPDEDTGCMYEAEFALQDHPGGLLHRINIWFEPDLRDKGRPRPHSHPWPFNARPLTDGYTEHRPGDVNTLPREVFHEVTELHDAPGRVLTLMAASAPGGTSTRTGRRLPTRQSTLTRPEPSRRPPRAHRDATSVPTPVLTGPGLRRPPGVALRETGTAGRGRPHRGRHDPTTAHPDAPHARRRAGAPRPRARRHSSRGGLRHGAAGRSLEPPGGPGTRHVRR